MQLRHLAHLAAAALLLPACSDGGSSSAAPAPVVAKPAAVAGEDQKAVPGFGTSFEAIGGWTLDAAAGGVGWAMDGTSALAPGGAVRTGVASLNYNNGTNFDNGGANSGAATSPEFGVAGHTLPLLVFWCNYTTETTGTAKDKRWLRISRDNFSTTVLSQQLSGAAAAPYQCAAMGSWHRHAVPVDPAWGGIRVRFFFESIDGASNAGEGWFIDDLSLQVRLTSKGSRDPSGGALTYLWTQTAGTDVVLSDPTATEPSFMAPALANPATPETLSFRLAVTGPSGTDTDMVSVTVKSLLVQAPDTWFVGYGNGGLVTAVSGGTSPVTWLWTGYDARLAVSGESSAILAYTAPALTDFQTFPDRADVALLQRTSQGRLQLQVKVVDAAGASDEDLVNFSVGPFADSVANENLALGEPAFLNGGLNVPASLLETATWTWSGIKPNGTAVAFFKPGKTDLAGALDQRYVYFVPDLPGDYEIQVKQNNGLSTEATKFILLTSGTYVGVGNRVGTPPDPFQGECAACHGGQFGWLADYATPWSATGHAKAFERLLDPVNPLYVPSQAKGHWLDVFNFGSPLSIDSRTTGWSRITAGANDGWTQRATAEGFVFKDASHDELVRKHPSTAALSGVQCESCHGPGSEHRADTTGIRKSFDSGTCVRCHASEGQHWDVSAHAKTPPSSGGGRAECNGCHTAQGFVVEMRSQHLADPHPVLFSQSNLNRPVIPAEDRRGTSCQACHDPHERTVGRGTPAGQPDPQLRAFGNVKFRNDAVVQVGNAASCYLCHQSRRDMRAGSPDVNARSGPHDNTAAEMLSATNAHEFESWGAYSSSPHGIPSRFVSPLFGENRQCLACHKDASPAAGAPGFGVLGGHSFAMTQGTGTVVADDVSHPILAETVAGTRKFKVASGTAFPRFAAPGDILTITTGADPGIYTVASVDGSRQLTLVGATPLGGGSVSDWSLSSTLKYNVASCTQCHTTASNFQDVARGDYDDDGNNTESVQAEIAGLLAKLKAAIEAKLSGPSFVNEAVTLDAGSSIRYKKTAGGATRTFPGPSVTSSGNPDISWASLPDTEPVLPTDPPNLKRLWTELYQAAYNYAFVTKDGSGGIHNTGYAVNLLQSSVELVTGTPYPSAKRFVPFP